MLYPKINNIKKEKFKTRTYQWLKEIKNDYANKIKYLIFDRENLGEIITIKFHI